MRTKQKPDPHPGFRLIHSRNCPDCHGDGLVESATAKGLFTRCKKCARLISEQAWAENGRPRTQEDAPGIPLKFPD